MVVAPESSGDLPPAGDGSAVPEPVDLRAGMSAFAERITDQIAPRTVLVVADGDDGGLAECLRGRGVNAMLENVSATDRLQAGETSPVEKSAPSFDLLVRIGSFDGLPEPAAVALVDRVCCRAPDALFLAQGDATTDDGLRAPEFWAAQFAARGFFRDLAFDAGEALPEAMRFRRLTGPLTGVIAAYEQQLWQLGQENYAQRALAAELRAELVAGYAARRQLADRVDRLDAHAATLEARVRSLEAEAGDMSAELAWRRQLEFTAGGRLLRRLQRLRAAVAPPGSRRDRWVERATRRP